MIGRLIPEFNWVTCLASYKPKKNSKMQAPTVSCAVCMECLHLFSDWFNPLLKAMERSLSCTSYVQARPPKATVSMSTSDVWNIIHTYIHTSIYENLRFHFCWQIVSATLLYHASLLFWWVYVCNVCMYVCMYVCMCSRVLGINVARLAGLPQYVIALAVEQSRRFENNTRQQSEGQVGVTLDYFSCFKI